MTTYKGDFINFKDTQKIISAKLLGSYDFQDEKIVQTDSIIKITRPRVYYLHGMHVYCGFMTSLNMKYFI